MTDLVQRLRDHNDERLYHEADCLMSDAADALEAKDKEIATMRYENVIRFGTSHPEMYKTELDEAKESIEHYKTGLDSAIQDIAKYKALCDQLGRALDGHCAPFLGHEQEHADALAAWREMK